MNRIWVSRWSLLLLASLPVGGLLAEDDDDAKAPSLELLEFLGNWETSDGEWLDPIELLEEIETEQETAKKEEKSDG